MRCSRRRTIAVSAYQSWPNSSRPSTLPATIRLTLLLDRRSWPSLPMWLSAVLHSAFSHSIPHKWTNAGDHKKLNLHNSIQRLCEKNVIVCTNFIIIYDFSVHRSWIHVFTAADDLKSGWIELLGRAFHGLDPARFSSDFEQITNPYLKEAAKKSLANAGREQESFYDFSLNSVKCEEGDLVVIIVSDCHEMPADALRTLIGKAVGNKAHVAVIELHASANTGNLSAVFLRSPSRRTQFPSENFSMLWKLLFVKINMKEV